MGVRGVTFCKNFTILDGIQEGGSFSKKGIFVCFLGFGGTFWEVLGFSRDEWALPVARMLIPGFRHAHTLQLLKSVVDTHPRESV